MLSDLIRYMAFRYLSSKVRSVELFRRNKNVEKVFVLIPSTWERYDTSYTARKAILYLPV